ncbi:Predicted hydrolase RP2 (NUDIX/MutT superfamily) [Ceraceosorus bombacis]|uniref:Predicted hydrolase RP2 (NUDIX/MutT superfamily) n=1 Tax=Ceraceosorus bombacis TaxID=401625 RepID=A0A0P1BEI6_9BASI|nr:Predicted hydrolase RP2 (NUDIX/MutT superfamily) [Ceraceosorus bombacis]
MSGDALTGSSKDDGEIGLPMTPRLSSTLVILAPSRSSGSTSSWEAPWMRTLMVQRSSRKGSSFRSAVVFPGGVVDDADFETAGIACEAKTYNDEKEKKADVKELAIRIAAVRETFEETGLLLVPSRAEARGSIPRCRAVGAGEAGMSVEEWTAMRDKVHTSAKTFLPFLQKVYERSIGSELSKGSVPVASMAAYSRWITPKTVVRPAKRFDAHFMLTVLDAEDVLSPAKPGPSGVERIASGGRLGTKRRPARGSDAEDRHAS